MYLFELGLQSIRSTRRFVPLLTSMNTPHRTAVLTKQLTLKKRTRQRFLPSRSRHKLLPFTPISRRTGPKRNEARRKGRSIRPSVPKNPRSQNRRSELPCAGFLSHGHAGLVSESLQSSHRSRLRAVTGKFLAEDVNGPRAEALLLDASRHRERARKKRRIPQSMAEAS